MLKCKFKLVGREMSRESIFGLGRQWLSTVTNHERECLSSECE